MGLFSSKRRLLKIDINFIKNNNGGEDAFIEYETDHQLKDDEDYTLFFIETFCLYYAKMLFNMRHCPEADGLMEEMKKLAEKVKQKNSKKFLRPNILMPNSQLLKEKSDNVEMTYTAELFEGSNGIRTIQTHMGHGNELYYSSASVMFFLQYLINKLPDVGLLMIVTVLMGMGDYYESNDYTKLRSLNAASAHGFEFLRQFHSAHQTGE